MHFDFKITTWERVEVSEENEKIVLDAMKNGDIFSAESI
jgi:hypothetical protein